MKLERLIPARRETIKFLWIRENFLKYNETWRDVRERGDKPKTVCWWCHQSFEDGDQMALGATDKGNKILCVPCAKEAKQSPCLT